MEVKISSHEQDLMEQFSTSGWKRTSWIESANDPASGFPLQSLPYCIFAVDARPARPGVGIGTFALDLEHCSRSGLLEGLPASIQASCLQRTLNALIACGAAAHASLRTRIMHLLDAQADRATRDAVSSALFPVKDAALLKPVESPNFTDFYASIHHAMNVGRLFRPDRPLLPNYMFVPIGYHGRASSIVVSGTPVRRPRGQTKPGADGIPGFGLTRFLDYEVEVGMYMIGGNTLGEPIPVRDALENVFGFSLVNDWSARDIQSWEYQPLGPFLGKSFATSVSPWIVPLAAFEPFRIAAALRPADDPSPLPYLFDPVDQYTGAIDVTLEAFLLTPFMRAAGLPPHRLSHASLRTLYWTPAQLVAHHTSNGCNLMPGDLLATGTVSDREPDSQGCLLELTCGAANPIKLPNGESRIALEDGDEVILRGLCRRKGLPEISLGVCKGTVLPPA